jgi:D-xylose transport system permease protein
VTAALAEAHRLARHRAAFGGRGKTIRALLGGLVIAAIANGMGLLGVSAATQYMVTALVPFAAVTVDAVARRGRTT